MNAHKNTETGVLEFIGSSGTYTGMELVELTADEIQLVESTTSDKILQWVDEILTEVDRPIVVPQVVAAWRIKAIAELQGLTASINAAIDAIADPATKVVARLSWDEGNEISRTSGLIVSMAAGLGLADEQLDGMFVAAANLPT